MSRRATTDRQRGFGIVEVMVAMLIALVGMIVIFQIFEISESYNRTAVSGSDAQQNGAYSLYLLQQEIRQAGWGFNNTQALGCSVLAYNATLGGPPALLTPGVAPAYVLAPVVINPAAAANASDALEVNYGNQNLLVAPVQVYQNQGVATDPFVLANRYGFAVGDLILASEPGKSCTLGQISSLPAAPSTTVNRASGGAYPFNQPGGAGVVYTTNGYLFDLGPAPVRDVFTVVNDQLTVVPTLTSNTQQVVADNIVQMRAQYGKDTSNPPDGIVDIYDNVLPASAAAWNAVLTVRIGLVARSAQPEKPTGGAAACNTTTAAPTWSGSATAPFDLTANANWQCYRYKVFETVIPVKNILWTQG
ncbi:MAG TPA: PilW family protein [Burkholderiales bacterium]|nr:PilW family protein [Burkholderiales bacterium]